MYLAVPISWWFAATIFFGLDCAIAIERCPERLAKGWDTVDASKLRFVQVGTPRTASTYQWYLICAILRARSLSKYNSSSHATCTPRERNGDRLPHWRLLKLHSLKEGAQIPDKPNYPKTIIFVSRGRDDVKDRLHRDSDLDDIHLARTHSTPEPGLACVAHIQDYTTFSQEANIVDPAYINFFGMTATEVDQVTAHLKLWQILRTCCGGQASFDMRASLHNGKARCF
jgi:hypothetical protein